MKNNMGDDGMSDAEYDACLDHEGIKTSAAYSKYQNSPGHITDRGVLTADDLINLKIDLALATIDSSRFLKAVEYERRTPSGYEMQMGDFPLLDKINRKKKERIANSEYAREAYKKPYEKNI